MRAIFSELRLETPRLILRPPSAEDFEPFAAFMADEEAARFIGGVSSRNGAWRGLMTLAGSWALEGFAMFTVIEKASGDWVGRVGPWRPADWPGDEVGWGIARSHWGNGYAVEAAASSMDWAFETLGWETIIHCIDDENPASRRVAEKLGSRKTGHEPNLGGQFGAVDIWSQTRADWAQNRQRLTY